MASVGTMWTLVHFIKLISMSYKGLKNTMPVLHNQISNKILKERMLAETEPRTTISFYKYFNIHDPVEFRNEWYVKFKALNVFGRVYIAKEGINAQISVPSSNVEALRELIYSTSPELNNLRLNIAIDDDGKSFWVLRMKVRDRVVADGITDDSFDASKTGQYLKAHEVNEMIDDPNTVFVDMRNHYEYEVGHFENAIEVPSDTFRDQLPMAVDMLQEQKDKNIVMYCTGGIRCEKASAYMLHNGFKNVYHVEGGIIEYARKAKEQGLPLRFKGKNFVFDNRMGSALLMKYWLTAINVVNLVTRIRTAVMMAVIYYLFSALHAQKNMKAAVVLPVLRR